MTGEWEKEWPTKPGWYWLWELTSFGKAAGQKPSMHLVQVRHDMRHTPVYVGSGRFLYKEDTEIAMAYWKPARLPKPPEVV